jgi:ABC-type molybdenum transport system ATPase subunit/photorepair protein PhrA
MPGLHLVLAHSPKCSSYLRVFGRQLRRVKWELVNRLISAVSSANSEKKSCIVAQLLA